MKFKFVGLNYRKLKKQSFLIYLFATIIMILPMAGMGYFVRGVLCLNILGFSFFPGTMTITLYIIAFVGFIIDYKKELIANNSSEFFEKK